MSWSVSGLRNGCAGVLVGHGRGVLGPDPAEAVGHQLGAHGAGVRPLRVLLRAVEEAELVLERVAVLVGDDVLLRERPSAGAELVLEDLEEARRRCRPACRGGSRTGPTWLLAVPHADWVLPS